MSEQLLKKGKVERAYAKDTARFMKKHGQSAGFISDEILRKTGEKVNVNTIYRWLSDKQTITLRTLDYIEAHKKRYE